MKRFLPRFFRCLLIAALVAAIAAPLAPTGEAIGNSYHGCSGLPDRPDEAGVESAAMAPTATPASTEVARGAPILVTLNGFPKGSAFTARIGGRDADFELSSAGTWGKLNVRQDATPGTYLVVITGQVPAVEADPDAEPPVEAMSAGEPKSASFLITIVSQTLTISPSWAVPGQAITVSGSDFNANTQVNLMLSAPNQTTIHIAGEGADDTSAISVNADGTFLYTVEVPFDNTVTAVPGTKTWTAGETTEGGRTASSSGFRIQARHITLCPSTALPGATVEVFGSGWGVEQRGSVNSQVTIAIQDGDGNAIPNAVFGPFPVGSTGEFAGAFTVPPDARWPQLTVTATDNNGPAADGGTDGFSANQTTSTVLRVPTGVVTLTPSAAAPRDVITVSGTDFPARTPLSELWFGAQSALPSTPPVTDATGSFTVSVTIPVICGPGDSCDPFLPIPVYARVAGVLGVAVLTIPGPAISLSTASARPGDTITITGTGFSLFANVDSIYIGQTSVTPTPNLLTDGGGNFMANVTVPALNPGAYTVIVRTGAGFRTATAGIRILSENASENARPPEEAFQELTSRGLLTLAAAMAPRGLEFGAYVPGLPGDTLAMVEPGGVLVLTLAKDARISVSGQPTVAVAANRPTFFALGAEVTVEVVS